MGSPLEISDRLIKDLAPKLSKAEFSAMKECCELLVNAYQSLENDGQVPPKSLETSSSTLIELIVSSEDYASYFGFYAFLDSPEDDDNYDTYWDGYCDFVINPKGLQKRMQNQS